MPLARSPSHSKPCLGAVGAALGAAALLAAAVRVRRLAGVPRDGAFAALRVVARPELPAAVLADGRAAFERVVGATVLGARALAFLAAGACPLEALAVVVPVVSAALPLRAAARCRLAR